MAEGKFIVFEGIDGAGTTTQSKLAAKWLRERSLDVVETAEPTDGAVGRTVRRALSGEMPGREGREVEPELFALLFAADRLDHMNRTVIPALERGQWGISDRCYLSSFAYQSVGCDLGWVRELNRHVRRADLTLLLDLDAEAAYERLVGAREKHEVFETADNMAVVRANYMRIAAALEQEGEKIVRVDASPPAAAVAEEVRRAISDWTPC